MSQLVRIPDGMRYMDMLEARIASLERQVAQSGVQSFQVTAPYAADRTFDPNVTSIDELARVLATLIDHLKGAGPP